MKWGFGRCRRIVNESFDGFSVSGRDIRFGLAAVKGVGRSFMKQLVEERETGGLFSSFQDFCERMYDRELNPAWHSKA